MRLDRNFTKRMKRMLPSFWRSVDHWLVKHLRVKQYSIYPYGKESEFMEALANLESFEAEYFGLGVHDLSPVVLGPSGKVRFANCKPHPQFEKNCIPSSQMKSLRIGQQKGIIITNVTCCTPGCSEHVSIPFNSHFENNSIFTVPGGVRSEFAMADIFQMIERAILKRAAKNPDKPNLKTFDFCCYHDEVGMESTQMQANGSEAFLKLLGNCIKHDVQVLNVGTAWFTYWGTRPEISSPDLGIPVLSLVNIYPCIFPVNMPNLERVVIRATSQSSPGLHWREERPDWPSLKSVEINVDCKRMSCARLVNGGEYEVTTHDARTIFQFFFKDIQRANLTEIRLHFDKEAGQLSIPKTNDIVESCPNLKKIMLNNWPGTNKALVKLWDGLPALEEISLEYCKDLGNVAFVGDDPKNPVFFKLKKLRKLSLKGLDQMPKITDLLFSLVLRHLNFAHLNLTSDLPLKSVTSDGILSLLEGSFAEKIERFPFQNWSLEDVPPEEFKKMEAKFRSYNML